MRAAAGAIVAAEKVEILPCGAEGKESRVECVLGDAVVAWEREGKGSDLDFHMVNLGGNTAHFRFAKRMVMIRVQVADEGEEGSCPNDN